MFPARVHALDTRGVSFPVRVHVLDPAGHVTAELALTDADHENLQLMVALAGHGRVVAYDRATGQTLFDSREMRLSWPDRPDPIAGQTG